MEEAKIKAYRVQVTDLENGEVVTDTIAPAYLCVTIANENNVGGKYSASLQGKSELVSMKGMMGLVVAGNKAGEDFLEKNILAVLKDLSGALTDEERGEFEELIKSLKEEEDEDDRNE